MLVFRRGRQFIEHVLPAVLRPLRVLWNQVLGFVFLVFAATGLVWAVRFVREFDGDTESVFRVLLSGLFTVVMGGFAIESFWRARKASR